MKIQVPQGAVDVGRGEDGRLAVLFTATGMEGAVMLDPKEFSEFEARELGDMLWRVCERWLAARQIIK
jgi:hypothetical protein|uniref:Uncharacterized protein n=1 Tax=Desulfobacca acetoxidans TaxID=60893 RepID=A0A7V6A3I5_9BACT